jgi:putative SOS response-associated peptidase YedK
LDWLCSAPELHSSRFPGFGEDQGYLGFWRGSKEACLKSGVKGQTVGFFLPGAANRWVVRGNFISCFAMLAPMCSNYFPTTTHQRLQAFGLETDTRWVSPSGKPHVWNHYPAPMVCRPGPTGQVSSIGSDRQLFTPEFGLFPYWSKTRKVKYSTFNARSETAASSSAYRGAWSRGQRCIIPSDWIVEPDWRTGKHVPMRIGRADGQPMGVAGLWDRWADGISGEIVWSFTMLTINADTHSLMQNFHRPEEEKRMVVILDEAQYGDWLCAPIAHTAGFLQSYPAEQLVTAPLQA